MRTSVHIPPHPEARRRVNPGQVSYYREALAWTNDDVATMLSVFPNFLSVKMENDVIEVIDYLRYFFFSFYVVSLVAIEWDLCFLEILASFHCV